MRWRRRPLGVTGDHDEADAKPAVDGCQDGGLASCRELSHRSSGRIATPSPTVTSPTGNLRLGAVTTTRAVRAGRPRRAWFVHTRLACGGASRDGPARRRVGRLFRCRPGIPARLRRDGIPSDAAGTNRAPCVAGPAVARRVRVRVVAQPHCAHLRGQYGGRAGVTTVRGMERYPPGAAAIRSGSESPLTGERVRCVRVSGPALVQCTAGDAARTGSMDALNGPVVAAPPIRPSL